MSKPFHRKKPVRCDKQKEFVTPAFLQCALFLLYLIALSPCRVIARSDVRSNPFMNVQLSALMPRNESNKKKARTKQKNLAQANGSKGCSESLLQQHVFKAIMAVVPTVNRAYVLESRKRPLEEPIELIDIKREKSDMEGNLIWFRAKKSHVLVLVTVFSIKRKML